MTVQKTNGLSVHNVLVSRYIELPLSQESTTIRDGNFLAALYGTDDEPTLALGTVPSGEFYLGTPALVWCGTHSPRWTFRPVWLVPRDWFQDLNPIRSAELLGQADRIAHLRKSQYLQCQTCLETMMPEHVDPDFHGRPTCHGCMTDQGVVF